LVDGSIDTVISTFYVVYDSRRCRRYSRYWTSLEARWEVYLLPSMGFHPILMSDAGKSGWNHWVNGGLKAVTSHVAFQLSQKAAFRSSRSRWRISFRSPRRGHTAGGEGDSATHGVVCLTAAAIGCPATFGRVADRPSKAKQCPVLVFRYSVYANEGIAPIRCVCLATGVMPGPGNGLHASQCGNEHPRASLLPHDEEPVWADGNASVAWLLPEGSAERS
jgi:hypothetical protein